MPPRLPLIISFSPGWTNKAGRKFIASSLNKTKQYSGLAFFMCCHKDKRVNIGCPTKLTMQKLIQTFFLCFILIFAFGQKGRKTSLYLEGPYNQTISDVTKGNNPWGMGLGLQMFFRQTSLIKPTVELTADTYLMGDKVYRVYLDGTPYWIGGRNG